MILNSRLASENDVLLIFNWANEELTRKNSFNTNPIEIEKHEKWFFEKLKDENALILIFENSEKRPVGHVRIEKKAAENIIGISIDADFRGFGLAIQMIKEACNLFFKKFEIESQILAYIKNENIASIKSFEKAGFVLLKKEKEYIILKLKKTNLSISK